jgi:E3 ubiquitin-protein ligase UBR1
LLKKSAVLVLYDKRGCIMNAPYLDMHGETDLGLRRGRPQFLNERRMKELKRLWLRHQIPSVVSKEPEDIGWQMM